MKRSIIACASSLSALALAAPAETQPAQTQPTTGPVAVYWMSTETSSGLPGMGSMGRGGGIDIMAMPPGKKLQNVLLLSGGEKAMTAIGLLFAIFKYKPSPFCILDEVDAPLDDANIGRFVKMLDTIRGDTQFIIITHSRKTMQIADNLYGVTMEEPGVSKLVSVKFN